ncbi:unnamed protein product, partial [Choristocarpus tenellus]
MFAGGAISWIPKVQRVVALSSTESEYIALSSMAQELLFLRSVFELIQLQFPRRCIDMFEENDSACKLVRNATSSTRTKHIDVRHHFLRDLLLNYPTLNPRLLWCFNEGQRTAWY